MTLTNFGLALVLAFVTERFVKMFIDPVKIKYPTLDLWWVYYVGVVAGAALSWFSNVNIFVELPLPVEIGRALTALGVGGGSTILADLANYLRALQVSKRVETAVNLDKLDEN